MMIQTNGFTFLQEVRLRYHFKLKICSRGKDVIGLIFSEPQIKLTVELTCQPVWFLLKTNVRIQIILIRYMSRKCFCLKCPSPITSLSNDILHQQI